MKMGGGFFWGLLLVIIGVSMIIKVVFHIDIPVFRIIIAFFFVFLGIKILTGNSHPFSNNRGPNDVIFGESNVSYQNKDVPKEQNIIFGKGTLDLRQLDSTALPAQIEINTVFGSSEIYLNKSIQVRIKVDAVFSGATLPNNNTSAFGSSYYESPGFDNSKPFLYINVNVVFGGVNIRSL